MCFHTWAWDHETGSMTLKSTYKSKTLQESVYFNFFFFLETRCLKKAKLQANKKKLFPSLLCCIDAILVLHVLLPAARKTSAFHCELVRYKECHPSDVLFAVPCPLFDKYFDVLFELQINYLLKVLFATT